MKILFILHLILIYKSESVCKSFLSSKSIQWYDVKKRCQVKSDFVKKKKIENEKNINFKEHPLSRYIDEATKIK